MCMGVTLIMNSESIVTVFKTCFHTSPKTYVVGAQKIHLNDNETVLLGKTDDTRTICVREYLHK